MGWRSGEWCCQHFRWAFERRARRGQFIFASSPTAGVRPTYSFWLAFRSVDREHLSRLPPSPLAPADAIISLSSMQAIFYCPWCGRRLARYYGRSAARLVDPDVCREFQPPGWEQAAPAEPAAVPPPAIE